MRGFIGYLMLIPFLLVVSLTIAVSVAPFTIVVRCMKWFKKGGLWRQVLGVIASLCSGGICIRLGYWLAIEGGMDWKTFTGFPEVRFPFLEWLFPIVFPGIGWIDIVGGSLLAVIGIIYSMKQTEVATSKIKYD